MHVIIVGGGYGGKKSSIITKIGEQFSSADECCIINGGELSNISGFDLALWMLDVSNDKEKQYPVKDRGTVLICSKVIHEGYTLAVICAKHRKQLNCYETVIKLLI